MGFGEPWECPQWAAGTEKSSFSRLLKSYPGFQAGAEESDYRDFLYWLQAFSGDDFQFHGTSESNEICVRMRFLDARVHTDFQRLKDENLKAFDELMGTIGFVRTAPGGFQSTSGQMFSDFNELAGSFLKSLYKDKPLAPADAQKLIDKYTRHSSQVLETIGDHAERIGISLLTIDEYGQALGQGRGLYKRGLGVESGFNQL